MNIEDLENNKELYVLYALKTNRVLRGIKNSIRNEILNFCKINIKNIDYVNELESEAKIRDSLTNLVKER